MADASRAQRVLFLPGASGVGRFWQPVIDRLTLPGEHMAFDYPGFCGNPPDSSLASLEDLTSWIETYIDRPVDIWAQSLGGVMAMQLALKHHRLVRHLVLTGTSDGVSMSSFDPEAWRAAYRQEAPGNPGWLDGDRTDLSKRIANLPMLCLPIFGTQDATGPLPWASTSSGSCPMSNVRLVPVDTDSHFFRARPAGPDRAVHPDVP